MKSLSDSKIKHITKNIRKIREFRDYTQEYLASRLDITQNAYSKIERGNSSITVVRLMEIADILEIDFKSLLCDDTNKILQISAAHSTARI